MDLLLHQAYERDRALSHRRILIIGGSGILSKDFAELLVRRGDEVYVLNRGRRPESGGVKPIIADWRNEPVEDLRNKVGFKPYDAVIDFLSFTPDQLKKCQEVVSGISGHYVFISSATAYRNEGDGEITEETPLGNPRWKYSMDKAECERTLPGVCHAPYTIIRPYVTFGKTRLPLQVGSSQYWATLLRIMCGDPVVLYESGEATCTLTSTKDFARALSMLLGNEGAFGEAFHITSGMTTSWKDVYKSICDIVGVEPHPISISKRNLLRYYPEEFNEITADKGRSWRFDNSKLLGVIGRDFQFKISIQQGLEESVQYLTENEREHRVSWRWLGETDRYVSTMIRDYHPNYLTRCNPTPVEAMKYWSMRNAALRAVAQRVKGLMKS